MGQFKEAINKQFPPKTDEQRTAYYAARRLQQQPIAVWQYGLVFWSAFVVIPFVYWMAS